MNRRLAGFVIAATAATLVQIPFGTPAQAATVVCNRYCDGRDPALSPSDRVPVSSTLYGRAFRVHVNDTDAMAWASVDGGQAGDEVWIDRSFDGGRTWTDNSRLGDTADPGRLDRLADGACSTSTTGAPAASARCGPAARPATGPEITCTRLGPQHLERLGPAHRRGDRADDALRPAAPACSTATAGGPAPTRSPR